jgi:hypothetical protein
VDEPQGTRREYAESGAAHGGLTVSAPTSTCPEDTAEIHGEAGAPGLSRAGFPARAWPGGRLLGRGCGRHGPHLQGPVRRGRVVFHERGWPLARSGLALRPGTSPEELARY